jgi:hypothetical protein
MAVLTAYKFHGGTLTLEHPALVQASINALESMLLACNIHLPNCDWYTDQYDHECNCGLVKRSDTGRE